MKQISIKIVTILLILINILIFFLYQDKDEVLTLLNQGALFAPYIIEGQAWRIISSMFMHGGILHLAMNMIALYSIGSALEKRIGHYYFILLYWISGIVAAYSSITFNLFTISVGASGAIFGMYAFDLLLVFENSNRNKRYAVVINFLIYATIIFFLGENFNFDHFAHLGGFLFGILFFIIYRIRPVYSTATLVFCLYYFLIPSFQLTYYNFFQFFIDKDGAMEQQLNSNFATEKEFSDKIKVVENIPDQVIDSINKLENVPRTLSRDTSILKSYMSIKNEIINHIVVGFGKESMIYYDSIYSSMEKLRNLPKLTYNLNFERPVAPPDTVEVAKKDSVIKIYYDGKWVQTNNPYEAEYYRVGYIDSLGDWNGEVYDYYRDGSIQMKGRYRRGLKDGVFIYYTENNEYDAAGRFREDFKVGKWESFHSGNILSRELRYTEEGLKYENIWDSTGRQTVINGHGIHKTYFNSGKLKSIEKFEDYQLKSAIGYKEDGAIHYKENYENNTLEKGVSKHKNETHYYDFSTYIPYPPGGYEKFSDYLNAINTLKTDTADLILTLYFDVTKEGEIHNIRFKERIGEPYDSFGKSLLRNGPDWIPAKDHGYQKIPSEYYIRINF